VLVVLAAAGGGLAALWGWDQDETLPSAGVVRLSVEPFHSGSLDVYVPVVDWGVRFPGVRMPARLQIEVRTIDRTTAAQVAEERRVPLQTVRHQAADAIAKYLRNLIGIVALASLATGAVAAFALRRPLLVGVAAGVAVAWAAAIALLLPPRGPLDRPEFYARGSDIPVALRALEATSQSASRLSNEVDSQLVGLARLVRAPAGRPSLRGLPRLTIASDLHNDIVAVPTIDQAADGGPVLFPGDLTDTGTALEANIMRPVVSVGHPFVFTAGNHDSDTLERRLVSAGAIVLDQRGRLLPHGRHGPVVVRVGGLRIAGYSSPNMRSSAHHYRDNGAAVTPAEQAAFLGWLLPIVNRVDVVMVHEPDLAAPAIKSLRDDPPNHPILFVVGHTHRQAVDSAGGITEVNGGTAGAGGAGNLTEHQNIGLAVVTYDRKPWQPLAADLVDVNPGTGGADARRVRLDTGAVHVGDPGALTDQGPP